MKPSSGNPGMIVAKTQTDVGFPYPGTPATADGSEGVVWVEAHITQGLYVIEELTRLVEEAILAEFDRLTERGGVLGAMETMYQRGKIQDESLYYEELKHTGDYPIIGVNTYLSDEGQKELSGERLTRSTEEEKQAQIAGLADFHNTHAGASPADLVSLKATARRRDNMFTALMECVKTCSLGQISDALYEVGGQYRRNM